MKTIYRRDETGAVYAWGGVIGLSRTLDERREVCDLFSSQSDEQ